MKFNKVSFEQYKKSVGGDEELKQEYDDILIPKRATKGSAGYDFFAPFDIWLEPNTSMVIPTGIQWVSDIDDYAVLQIYPRSGLGFKYQIGLSNTVGIVDAKLV